MEYVLSMHRAFTSYIGSTLTCVFRRFVFSSPRSPPGGTLLDAIDVSAVVSLVRILSRSDEGADLLADRLTCLYRTFPPTEVTMRRLSLMHQQYCDEGGLRSFCVAMVYMAATEAILHDTTRISPLRRGKRPHSR